jgi:hypothetical protein
LRREARSADLAQIASPRSDSAELPGLFRAADQASLTAQRQYIWLRVAQLAALVIAAVLAMLDFQLPNRGLRLGPALAAVAFAFSGLVEASMLSLQLERVWYQARAVAESIKTLAWRYAVGGRPFPVGTADAELPLVERFHEIVGEFRELRIVPRAEPAGEVTAWMRRLRAATLDERREAYLRHRIENQRDWYARKAAWNQRRAVAWTLVILATQTLGVLAGILRAGDAIPFDLLGVLAALAASVVAWIQIKQHATLAASYSVAGLELTSIAALIESRRSEESWASFVDDAENAISREHTTWRAKRA